MCFDHYRAHHPVALQSSLLLTEYVPGSMVNKSPQFASSSRMSLMLVAMPRSPTAEWSNPTSYRDTQSSLDTLLDFVPPDRKYWTAPTTPLTYSPIELPDGPIHYIAHLRYPLTTDASSLEQQHLEVFHNPFHSAFGPEPATEVPKIYKQGHRDIREHVRRNILLTLAFMYGEIVENDFVERLDREDEEIYQRYLMVSGCLTEKCQIEVDWAQWGPGGQPGHPWTFEMHDHPGGHLA